MPSGPYVNWIVLHSEQVVLELLGESGATGGRAYPRMTVLTHAEKLFIIFILIGLLIYYHIVTFKTSLTVPHL